jgi:DNA-binding SARP family transcriptional activator
MARASYEEGLAVGEASGDRQALVPGRYQLAKVLVNDEPDRALQLAEEAVGYGWPDYAWALNALGWIALALGDRQRAAHVATEAAEAARERRDHFGLAESLELRTFSAAEPSKAVDHLTEARRIWREIGSRLREAATDLALARLSGDADARALGDVAERRLQALGVRISPAGPAGLLRVVAGGAGTTVAIQTLGGFVVRRGGEPVSLAEWGSRKARELLKILVARRGRPIPREVLMDALWPGEDPSKLANRLSVALSSVRAVLDPEKRFPPEHFVGGDRDALGLDESSVAVDVESFLVQAATGLELRREGRVEEARERLFAAEAAYAGDFLEESPYSDWAVSLREEARATSIAVVRALAEDASDSGDHDAAARYLLRVLERDPYDEHASLALVRTLDSAGRHGEARRHYGNYVARMTELGAEPAPLPQTPSPARRS